MRWGKFIDKHEVVRMKDFGPQSWQRKRPEDYGTRLDFWCCSTEIMPEWWTEKLAREYWAQPKKGFWNPENERVVRSRGIAPQIDLDLFQRWNQVHCAITDKHRNYSLGVHCIIKVCERGEVPLLVGFDNLLDPERPYLKANKGSWKSNHDWIAERQMLPVIEKNYGVRVHAMTADGPKPWDTVTT